MIKLDRIFEALRRRRRLIATISLLVTVIGLSTYETPEKMQRIEMHFIVGQTPLVETTVNTEEERYFRWVASEYIVFGVYDWSSASAFSEGISRQMIAAGHEEYDTEKVDEDMYAGVSRSKMLLGVIAPDEEIVRDFADIAATLLIEQAGQGIPQLENEPAAIYAIDSLEDPLVVEINQPVSAQMALPMRLIVGMLSGFVIATLIEVFDPTIRYRETVKRLKLPILGEIPKA